MAGIGVVDKIEDLYPIDTSCKAFIDRYLSRWQQIYEGEPPWKNGCDPEKYYHLNVAKVVCGYLSKYNTAEPNVMVSPVGMRRPGPNDDGPDPAESEVNQFIQKTLADNAFYYNLTVKDELKEALGGLFMKPYNDGKRFVIDFVSPTSFYPIAWDNRRFTQGVFKSVYTEGERLYTRLEAHLLEKDEDRTEWTIIENRLFVKDKDSGADLGTEISLEEYSRTQNVAPIIRFDYGEPLFSYVYPNEANNKDPDSPYRLSRFANSLDTLKAIDKAFNEWQTDRGRSRKIITAPYMWFNKKVDEETGRVTAKYDEDTDVYQLLNYHPNADQEPHLFAPTYEIEKHIQDIDAGLGLICLQTGLSAGSISFDSSSGGVRTIRKTAQEIRSEDSETFTTVNANQAILTEGITDLIKAILYLAQHPDFALLPAGEQYEISVDFDDSVTPDRDTYIAEGRNLVQDRLISKRRFLMEYYKLTKQDAEAEIALINQETSQERATIPNVFGTGGD